MDFDLLLIFVVASLPLFALGAYYIWGAEKISAKNPPHTAKTYKTTGIISMVIAAAIIIGGIITSKRLYFPTDNIPSSSTSSSNSSSSMDAFGHDKIDAITITKKIVGEKLKAPSTAKFCKSTEYTITCSHNTWTVKGWVDAQNSFGAMIRSDFTVKFTFSSSNEYTVSSCVIN